VSKGFLATGGGRNEDGLPARPEPGGPGARVVGAPAREDRDALVQAVVQRRVLCYFHRHSLLDEDGTIDMVWYSTPFVDEVSLGERLTREKQLPIQEAVRTANELAEALDCAHRQGAIHRDIKPERILLHDGRALVAELGITLAGRKLDARTDVYVPGPVPFPEAGLFWRRLHGLCAQAFEGRVPEVLPGEAWWEADRSVMHVRRPGDPESGPQAAPRGACPTTDPPPGLPEVRGGRPLRALPPLALPCPPPSMVPPFSPVGLPAGTTVLRVLVRSRGALKGPGPRP
jgi:hypothetical protein